MDKPSLFVLIVSLLSTLSPGLYGVLGSAGFYVHEIIQQPDGFEWSTFSMYCFLGFVVALMFFKLPEIANITHTSGFLIAAGFSVRKITEMSDKVLGLGVKLPKKN